MEKSLQRRTALLHNLFRFLNLVPTQNRGQILPGLVHLEHVCISKTRRYRNMAIKEYIKALINNILGLTKIQELKITKAGDSDG